MLPFSLHHKSPLTAQQFIYIYMLKPFKQHNVFIILHYAWIYPLTCV